MADPLWEELVAIRSSLLPEEFRWRGTSDEQHAWECAYQEYQATWVAPAIQQVHVALRVSRALGVLLYARLDAREALPTVTVMVECPELVSHAAMTAMVQARLAECRTQAVPHPTFDVLMLLQEALSEQEGACSMAPQSSVHETPTAYAPCCDMKRVLFWTHHLVAPSKRKQFAAWCPEMHVWGILKLGYPGFLCFEGATEDVDDMVRRVKGMQWHALSLRIQAPWVYTRPAQTIEPTSDAALRACCLAPKDLDVAFPLRTRCEEYDTMSAFLDRYVTCTHTDCEQRVYRKKNWSRHVTCVQPGHEKFWCLGGQRAEALTHRRDKLSVDVRSLPQRHTMEHAQDRHSSLSFRSGPLPPERKSAGKKASRARLWRTKGNGVVGCVTSSPVCGRVAGMQARLAGAPRIDR